MGQEVVPRLRSFAQLRKLRPGAGRCVVQAPTVAGTGNSAFLTPWPVLAVLPAPFLSGVPLGPWVCVANLSSMLGQPSAPIHTLFSP